MRITVRNLTKHFDKVHALDKVTFSLDDRSVTGLIGPNGAGKSTLLRLMACRELPTDGDILYDGTSVLEHPLETLPLIGLMPDSLPEKSSWKVGPYLDFFARANNLRGEERQAKLDEIISLMKLETFLDRKLDALSKGMKQRVSLGRILLAGPQVLLMDEPAAGLDPNARIELRECIRLLNGRGITIIISSHILSDLEDICDSLVVLEKGALRWSGKLDEWHRHQSASIRIALDFTALPEGIEATLQSLPHFRSVTITGRKSLEVTLEGGDHAVDEFMVSVYQAHLQVNGMRVISNSIEELFLQTTQGGVQ